MENFDYYSQYYDLLYKDKDYKSECDYVVGLLNRFSELDIKRILELGCGTGNHANYLEKYGYSVLGLDQSARMIELASQKYSGSNSLQFEVADIRNYQQEDGYKFDSILSLFHVISYQNRNEDLISAFKTANNHLMQGGVFIFDFWYGPAVLSDLPSIRYKELENDSVNVKRISIPTMRLNENIVDVEFKIIITDKERNSTSEIYESHSMRYLFIPEIENLLSQAGLKLIGSYKWLSEELPNGRSWNVVCVAQK